MDPHSLKPLKLCNIPLTAIASYEKTGKTSPTYEVIITQKNLRAVWTSLVFCFLYFLDVLQIRQEEERQSPVCWWFKLHAQQRLEHPSCFCVMCVPLIVFANITVRDTSYDNNGWNIYNPEKEYLRLGVTPSHPHWRISNFNKDWKEIPSYPEYIVVPKCIPDTVLKYGQ